MSTSLECIERCGRYVPVNEFVYEQVKAKRTVVMCDPCEKERALRYSQRKEPIPFGKLWDNQVAVAE